MEFNIEKFSPTVAELQTIVTKTKDIVAPEPTDKKALGEIREHRLELRDARTGIKKLGKELRQGAVDFQRKVIAKEKELLEIVEPEEQRLKGFEDDAESFNIKEERKAVLPERKEKLESIGDDIKISDEEILDMDDVAFGGYHNQRLADQVEAANKAKADKEAEVQRAKDLKEAEAKGKKEAEEKAAKEAKEEKERKAKEEEDRKKDEKFQAFLKEHGHTEETKVDFHIEEMAGKVRLYKLVAVYDELE